ncbi:MAG: zf-HC2 domain-containing protein [Anaerolineales bacterium]|nr:zf-HC2 domain-containing protein [Anaerolineales bacterium]
MRTLSSHELEQLYAYLDGELGPQDLARFETQLQESADLRAALETERQFRAGFRTRLRHIRAPFSLQTVVQTQEPEKPTRWQAFVVWWLAPKAFRPAVALLGLLVWSVCLMGLSWQAGRSSREAIAIQEFITKHELYFEGQPSLDMSGTQDEIDAWIARQAPFEASAPVLGEEWTIAGVRLDDFAQRRMIDILYFKENGLDASLSIFEAQNHVLPTGTKVTYNGMDYYVTDDGWHRTIVWISDGIGYALVGNLVISADHLFTMAATVRAQLN